MLLLDVPAALAGSLAARLDALIFAEDVQIDDASASMAVLQLFTAAEGAAADGATDGTDAQMGGVARAAIEIPDPTFGVPSRVAYVPSTTWNALFQPCPHRHMEVGLDALEVLRVEAGVPRFLVDMTEDTIPLEAGLEDRAISFTKGCYVGQEIIVRVTTRGGGRVARKLVGLRVEPGPGAAAASAPPSMPGSAPLAGSPVPCSRPVARVSLHWAMFTGTSPSRAPGWRSITMHGVLRSPSTRSRSWRAAP